MPEVINILNMLIWGLIAIALVLFLLITVLDLHRDSDGDDE